MKEQIFTTHRIAKFCKVDTSTVTNWVDKGMLKAYKTPGGHRRIKKEVLLAFLKEYGIPVPAEITADKLRVLIVDDNAGIVKIITRAINKKYKNIVEVEPAYDGYEAGKKVGSFYPDLVILDINLPGVDGFRVLEDIKANKELKGVKVLAISGKNIAENKEKILSIGADEFLAKPFGNKEVVSCVARLLELPEEKEAKDE